MSAVKPTSKTKETPIPENGSVSVTKTKNKKSPAEKVPFYSSCSEEEEVVSVLETPEKLQSTSGKKISGPGSSLANGSTMKSSTNVDSTREGNSIASFPIELQPPSSLKIPGKVKSASTKHVSSSASSYDNLSLIGSMEEESFSSSSVSASSSSIKGSASLAKPRPDKYLLISSPNASSSSASHTKSAHDHAMSRNGKASSSSSSSGLSYLTHVIILPEDDDSIMDSTRNANLSVTKPTKDPSKLSRSVKPSSSASTLAPKTQEKEESFQSSSCLSRSCRLIGSVVPSTQGESSLSTSNSNVSGSSTSNGTFPDVTMRKATARPVAPTSRTGNSSSSSVPAATATIQGEKPKTSMRRLGLATKRKHST